MKRLIYLYSLYISYFIILTCLFIKYVFVVGSEINPFYMIEENNVPGRKRQSYKKKIYNFQSSEKGKKLMNNLNILTENFHEISAKAEIKIKNKVAEDEHHREVIQYIEFLENKQNFKELLKDIKQAVKEVYSKGTTAIEEEEEVADINNEIQKKIEEEKNVVQFPETEEEEEENKILKNKDEVRNAIVLDNMIKLLKSLKKSLSEEEYQKIINNKKFLLEKLLRPDAILDETEFKKYYTGVNLEGVIQSPTIELPRLDFDENNLTSFLQMRDKSPNFCTINDKECDRRKHPDSCESRLEVEDQSGCASCWVFAGLHSIELSHCMASGKDTIYSRQEIIDCSTRECKGGYLGSIAAYLHEHKRLADEGSYPYEVKKVFCRSHVKENVWTGNITEEYSHETSHILSRTTHSNFTDDEWNTFIKKIVVKHGAVVVYLGSYGLRYTQGVPTYMCQTYYDVNHAVIITGWKILAGIPVWIIRNSWGNWWSDNGYAYVAIENHCEAGFYPIHKIHVGQLGDWSDRMPKYEVINVNTRTKKNKSVKSESIDIGEEKQIYCKHEERMHIRNYYVVSYKHAVSNEKTCDQLDIKNKCENQQNCRVYFPHHACDPYYKLLYVEYECLTGLAPYDCTLSKSIDSRLSDKDCVLYCRSVAPKCTPVTMDCLHRSVSPKFCNFDAVLKSEDLHRKQKEEELQRKQKEEKLERKQKEEELEKKYREQELERRQRDKELQRRQREQELQRKQRDEEIKRRQTEKEKQRKQRDEEVQKRQREEELRKKQTEEEVQRRQGEKELRRRQREEEIHKRRKDEDLENKETKKYLERKTNEKLQRKEEKKISKFNCTKAVSKINSNKVETCITDCGLYISSCSTAECLNNKISKDKCNLSEVFKGFDCGKTVAIRNASDGPICISHCRLHSQDCSTLDCLKEKVPNKYCDITNVVYAADCNKAKAEFIPDESVSHLCAEHCQYYAPKCNTLECIYTNISKQICDLSKII